MTQRQNLRRRLLRRYTARRERQYVGGPDTNYAAAAAPFLPTQIGDLSLWLAADYISGLADAASVSQWNDLSGNGNHVSQGTGANQPAYKVAIVNGKPVVRFNGTSHYLSGSLTTTQPATVFVVGSQTATTTHARFIDSIGAGRQILNLAVTTGRANIYAGISLDGAVDRSGAFHILNGIFNGASSYFYIDGTTADIGPADAGAGAGAVTLLVGFDNGTAYLTGDVAEIIYYARLLSAGEKSQVDAYLGSKYGITVV